LAFRTIFIIAITLAKLVSVLFFCSHRNENVESGNEKKSNEKMRLREEKEEKRQ